MNSTQAGSSEGAIFSRVVEPDRGSLSSAAARAILAFAFAQADQDRMRDLSAKARDGDLSSDEQAELDNFERVGHLLALMKLKARNSLKKTGAKRKTEA